MKCARFALQIATVALVTAALAGDPPCDLRKAQLFVRESPAGGLVAAEMGVERDAVTALADAGLSVTARISQRPDHSLVSGVVVDTRGAADRAVDVVFRVPFASAVWWGSISETVPPDAAPRPAVKRCDAEKNVEGAAVLEPVEDGGLAQNFLPVACVTAVDGRAGLALAIPPDAPCRFRFAYRRDEGCLELQFLFGLSPAATGEIKNRATFCCEVFSVDGRWGLRDAWRRYMERHAERFQRRTKASGLWLVSAPSLKDVSDPRNYAFWQATRLAETPMALRLGMEAYPYTIVGQREVGYIKKKVVSYDDVLRVLAEKPETTRRSRYAWEEVKRLVETSGLRGADGRWLYRLRETEWAGNSVSFPVNPSPFLPSSEARPTVAEHTLAEVARALRDQPGLHGFFVDSLAMWGSYENFRRDHFAAARAPLAHDARGRVCLPNWMPHVDYLRELRRRIAPRLVFGNGARPGRAFCAFELDVLGAEFAPRDLGNRQQMDFLRCVAGPKPALGLFDYAESGLPRAQMEEYVQCAIALGIAPETRHIPWPKYKDRDADLLAKFLPIHRRLDLAGWQPVTHATVEPRALWLERFGTKPPDLYFTLYNPTDKPLDAQLTLDRQALGLTPGSTMQELVAGTLAIPARAMRVVQIQH
jgi:hypothetical protein